MYTQPTRAKTSPASDAGSEALNRALETWANHGGTPMGGEVYDHEPTQRSSEILKKIADALNQQIQHEQSNAHAYQAVSLYFRGQGLRGLALFMAGQADEERWHANKLIQHVCDRNGRVELKAISAPQNDFDSPLDAIRHIKQMEMATTQTIHRLYEHASNENDYALQVLLHWFIAEQVEEEKWTQELESLFRRFADDPAQLLALDQQWTNRANT